MVYPCAFGLNVDQGHRDFVQLGKNPDVYRGALLGVALVSRYDSNGYFLQIGLIQIKMFMILLSAVMPRCFHVR